MALERVDVAEQDLGRAPEVLLLRARLVRVGDHVALDLEHHAHRPHHELDTTRWVVHRLDQVDVLLLDRVERLRSGAKRGDGLSEP